MSCLGIDLVYSQVAGKPGTVNWRLHFVSDFLNCLSNTCPKRVLARTLQRQAAISAWKKSLHWDKGWGQGWGHRPSVKMRKVAVILKPSLWNGCAAGEGHSRLKLPLGWSLCVAFCRKLGGGGLLCQGPAAFKRCSQLLSHWAAEGICHWEYEILAAKSIFLETSMLLDCRRQFKAS